MKLRNVCVGQFSIPRGRWVRACPVATSRNDVLHPRNSWTPGNVRIVRERSK
jgi:hypothetical protein